MYWDSLMVSRVDKWLEQVVENYYDEIDKYPISATQKLSDTIQLGNINDWKSWDLEDIDLIIGGSPCQVFISGTS